MGSPEDGGKDQDQRGDQKTEAQAVTEGLNSLIAILTAGLFVWFGTRIAVLNLGSLMPGLGISAFWQYLAVPVSGVLMLAPLAERAIYGRTAAE